MSRALSALLVERLVNQKLARSTLRDPCEVVSWFGAVQAQDFQGARWAIGLRTRAATDTTVERAFNDGAILRTHVLRPTWHFVVAADIRWLIALTGPRIIARMAWRHRQLELDPQTVRRSRTVLTRALGDGPLTRRDLAGVLQRTRILVTPERLSHLLALAELEGLVCSGPLRDRQFTYALIDHRVPGVPPVAQEEARARLAERYFRSHGPATLADFAWWSGLSMREARSAVEMAGTALSRDALVTGTYRFARSRRRARTVGHSAFLLPSFDEFLVAYKDRSAILGDRSIAPRDVLAQTVIVDGRAAGLWRARRENGSVTIAIDPRRRLPRDVLDRIRDAAARYGAFIGQPVTVERG